jgi:hypothetical protein
LTLRAMVLAAGFLLVAIPPGFAVEIQPEGAAPLAASGAGSQPSAPSASPAQAGDAAALADVNLFPAQTFDSLTPAPPGQPQAGAEVPPPPLETAAAPEMEPPPPQDVPMPFVSVAQWKDSKRQAFAVEGLGQIFVFCGKCHVPGAVHPGEAIAGGYRLEKLDETHATLLTPDGQERALTLVGTTQ